MLILTGHFGNFEVSTSAGLASFPEAKGRFHFVRRPIRPEWLDKLVTRRFRKAGFGVLPKRGGLDMPSSTGWPRATWWSSPSTSMRSARTA